MSPVHDPRDDRVLEDNLRRLLRRAYVPARPSPAFRAALTTTFLEEFERRHVRRAAPPRPRRLPRLVLGLAAAAALVLVALKLFGGSTPAATPEGLLAAGTVALREDAGAWRGVEGAWRFDGTTLEVRTPAGLGQALLVEEGTWTLGAAATLTLAAGTDLRGELAAGSLELRRPAGGAAPWRLSARGVELALAQGELLVRPADDGGLTVLLLAGAASARHGGDALALEPGRPVTFRPGSARVVAGPGPGPADGEARTPLPAPAPEAPAATVPGTRGASLLVHLAAAGDEPLPDTVELGLLLLDHPNRVSTPVRRELPVSDGRVRWDDPPRGPQRLYVHATGRPLITGPELTLGEEPVDAGELVFERGGAAVGAAVDAATGAPLPDVLVVSLRDLPSQGLPLQDADRMLWTPAATRADRDGRFRLEPLSPGRHLLQLSVGERAPRWVEVTVPADGTTDVGTVALERGGTVEGEVRRDDGSPWSGVQLLAARMDKGGEGGLNFALARTDDFGRFRIEALPAELMMVVMLGDPDRPQVRPVQVLAGAVARVDFDTSRRGTRLVGRILDAGGRPLVLRNLGLFEAGSAHSAAADWEATTTDADGGFVFEALAPGRYGVMVVDDVGSRLAFVAELDVPDVAEHRAEVHLSAGRLTGAVRDGHDGTPVRAVVHVEVLGDGGPEFQGYAETDDAGRFRFEFLRDGRYVTTAYPLVPGLGHQRSDPVQIDALEPVAEVVHALPAGGAVEVLVRSAGGEPVPYATVTLIDVEGAQLSFAESPLTDEGGRFVARGVAAGRYRVQARRGERVAASPSSTVCRPGETTRVELDWPTADPPSEDER